MSEAVTCGSCGISFAQAQKFCGQCGQPVPTRRIDWHFLSHEVQHGLLHVDKGILFTVKHLLSRPGAMIRDYLAGNRAGHFKPVLLVMVLGVVLAMVTKFVGFVGGANANPSGSWSSLSKWLNDASRGDTHFENPTDRTLVEHFALAVDWVGNHFALTLVLLVPFFALAMRMAFSWHRRPVNYPEWLVIGCFLTAQALCIFILIKLVGAIFPAFSDLSLLIVLAAQSLTIMRLFRDNAGWRTLLRFFTGYAIYSMIFGILIVVVSILVMVWAIGPDAFINQINR